MPSSNLKFGEQSLEKNLEAQVQKQDINPSLSDRQKRPDLQIYVPRALRDTKKKFSTTTKIPDLQPSDDTQKIFDNKPLQNNLKKPVAASYTKTKTGNNNSEIPKITQTLSKIDGSKKSCLLTNENVALKENETYKSLNTLECIELSKIKDIQTFTSQTSKYNESTNVNNEITPIFQDFDSEVTDSSVSSEDVNTTTDKSREDACPKEDSWEANFDDDGECLNPEFLQDLKNITGQIKVLVARNNYEGFVQVNTSTNTGYDCIIELYDFPREFSTQDLVSAFSQFHQANYSIQWVDDCHALAIFSNPSLVNQALLLNHPFVKTRPISEGIKESQEKARWCAKHDEPTKPRPTTSTALARRLVSGALGLRVQMSKEQRDKEKSLLKEEKEKRRLKARQKQAIWDGEV